MIGTARVVQILSTTETTMRHMVSRIAGAESDNGFSGIHWMYNDNINGDTIDGDADGRFTSGNTILVDLSNLLSAKLGRQMSQMSTYKVDYISVEMVNADGFTLDNDNESGLEVNGQILYWSPTNHRVDAMQLARQLELTTESTQLDADSFLLSTEKDYSGMRFNWSADGQVKFATVENFTELQGTEWDLLELFQIYGNMQGGPQQGNALWNTRTGGLEKLGFTTSYSNYTRLTTANIFDPKSNQFVFDKEIDVLAGLLAIDFTHSSVDSSLNTVDDDYQIRVTVGVTGWSDF